MDLIQAVQDILKVPGQLEVPSELSPFHLSHTIASNDDRSTSTGLDDYPETVSNFQMHDDQTSTDDVLDILSMIRQDLLSFSYVHDWDRKLRPDYVKAWQMISGKDQPNRIYPFEATSYTLAAPA